MAYVVVNRKIDSRDLGRFLRQKLPDYMIPIVFVQLDHLALTPTGKVDRRKLPAPEPTRPDLEHAYVGPRTEVEAEVAAIWADILDVEQVGVHDNFFELGGHSLLTLRLAAQLERKFGVDIPLKSFFRNPSVAELAAMLSPDRSSKGDHAHDADGTGTRVHPDFAVQPEKTEALDALYERIEQPRLGADPKATISQGWHGRRRWASAVANALPYPVAYRLLSTALEYPSMQDALFRYYIRLIRRFLGVLDIDADENRLMHDCLLFGSLFHYRIGPWGRVPRDEARRQEYANRFSIEGKEQLQRFLDQERGVVLVCCHDNAQSWSSLLQLGSYNVGGVHIYLKRLELSSSTLENSLFSHQLNTARRTLQRGGVVTIAGDGHHGRSSGIRYDFHGRWRPFRTSFAELAFSTGATVFAVFNHVDSAGQVYAKIVGPLDPVHDMISHDARVRGLVDQYVALLDSTWREEPWMVPWFQMEKHLAYPPPRETQAPPGVFDAQ